MSFEMWPPVVATGLVSLIVPFALRKILIKRGVVDVPNERSSHNQPTLRGGGVAALLGIVVGVIWLLLTNFSTVNNNVIFILSVSVCVGIVGLFEDIIGLRIFVRAGFQLLAGTAIGIFLWSQYNSPLILLPIIAFIFAFHVNLTNFMDGINGISSIHGFVVGAIFSTLGISYSQQWLALVGAMISVAFVAFLPWNLSSPGMFLGDVGSYLLGASIGVTALVAVAEAIPPLLVFSAVSIYWADAVFTLVRRLLQREPIFKAHRSHAYQQLTDTGFSHVQVAVIVAFFTLLITFISCMVVVFNIPWVIGVILILVVIIFYLFLPKIRGK